MGNGAYGKTAQGLNAKTSKVFGTNNSYYVPVSKSTNPLIAMQYTAIARYQVNFLMDLLDRLYPNNLIPSVTTDGFIWAGNQPLDKDEIVEAIRKNAPKQWVDVNDNYFNGNFFEFKSKLIDDKKECSKNTYYLLKAHPLLPMQSYSHYECELDGCPIQEMHTRISN